MADIPVSLVVAFLAVFVEDAEASIYNNRYYNTYYYTYFYYGPSIGSIVGGCIGGLVMLGVLIAVCCICARRRNSTPGQLVYTNPAQPSVVVAQTGATGQPYPTQGYQPTQGYYPQYPQYPQDPQGYAQSQPPFGSPGNIPPKTDVLPPPYGMVTQSPGTSDYVGPATAAPY